MFTKRILIAALAASLTFANCKKKDEVTTTNQNSTTNVSGNVEGVWKSGDTKIITDGIIIPAGKSLTIEEGVTIIFRGSKKELLEVLVKGNLYAKGTATNPIKFTVDDSVKTKSKFGAQWGGIVGASTSAEIVFEYTILEYGGATTTEESPSVKNGLYKAEAGEAIPAFYFANTAGKLIFKNNIIRNFNEDAMYLEGGEMIIANNIIHTNGSNDGGDAINIKAGVKAEVANNLIFSPNTNCLKLSNSGDRTPQARVIAYNNTFVNAGWRRPEPKGGSVWLEAGVHADIVNNLFVNCRFGVKRDTKKPEDDRSIVSNNQYYGYTADDVDGFKGSTSGIIVGSNNVKDTITAGANDPMFENYDLSNGHSNYDFNSAWKFKFKANAPGKDKGTTTVNRLFASGLTVNGIVYTTPAPSAHIGDGTK